MEMTANYFLNLIQKGEGISTEFKTCRNQINRDVYETICAFMNRHGGILLLGVSDSGDVHGIDPVAISQIKKDFATVMNNPQKITPSAYLSLNEFSIEEKQILFVYVPESSQVHRCNGRIYDRNEDGDFDITEHTLQVANLFVRKQATFTENRIYSHVKIEDLRADMIDKCRRIVRINNPGHPWTDMNDMQLIQSSQLYQKDPQTGESGLTLACLLLFGTDNLILTALPAYRTDLILRKNNDRYDDRDIVRTNLIDSYDRIIAFAQKHLPDPFFLEETNRISLRDIIFREIASNILIHREYTNATPARLIIENGQVMTENANRPHGFGVLNPATFNPYPKNPVIGAFFREIQRADELGSGIRNLMKYGKIYGGADPKMTEGDIFKVFIPLPREVTPEVAPEVTPEVLKIIFAMRGEMDRASLQSNIGLKDEKNFRQLYLRPALDGGVIEMTIPDKPKSSRQKYRLTEQGQIILKKNSLDEV